MKPTRLATILALAIGVAGLTALVVAEALWMTIVGAAAVLGAFLLILRHFWRLAERNRQQQNKELETISKKVAEIQQSVAQFEELQRTTSKRVEAFTRGVLEETSQLQIDMSELTIANQRAAGHLEQVVTEQAGALHKELDSAAARREMVLGQVEGLISLYAVLSPERPYPTFGGWAVSADTARRLVRLIMDQKPSWVIETGSGLSTLLAAQTLELLGGEGRVMALEHDKGWLDVTAALLKSHGMHHRVDLVHSPLVDVDLNGESFLWYDLSHVTLPKAEVVFVDGPPTSTGRLARYPALPLLWRHLSPNGTLLLDDASREDEGEAIRRWSSEFPGLDVKLHRDVKGSAEIRLNPS